MTASGASGYHFEDLYIICGRCGLPLPLKAAARRRCYSCCRCRCCCEEHLQRSCPAKRGVAIVSCHPQRTAPITAKALAARMEKEGGIAQGFRLCTNREPTTKELQALEALAKRQSTRKDALPPMVAIARVLLNLDETITKE